MIIGLRDISTIVIGTFKYMMLTYELLTFLKTFHVQLILDAILIQFNNFVKLYLRTIFFRINTTISVGYVIEDKLYKKKKKCYQFVRILKEEYIHI